MRRSAPVSVPTHAAAMERWIEGLGGDGNLHHLVATFLLAEHANRGFFAPYVDGLPAKSVRYLPHQYNATELAWLGSGEHAPTTAPSGHASELGTPPLAPPTLQRHHDPDAAKAAGPTSGTPLHANPR